MHAQTDVRSEVTFQQDKSITMGAFAKACLDEGLGRRSFERLIEAIDTQVVRKRCGKKYTRGNGTRRYQRAGTAEKQIVTVFGSSTITLSYIKDTDAEPDEQTYYRPIEEFLEFNGIKRYQQCISTDAATIALDATYRTATAFGNCFTSMPSPATINRRVIEFGQTVTQHLSTVIDGRNVESVIADSTKVYSQEDDAFHEVNLTISRDGVGDSHETTVLDVNVNTAWETTATKLSEKDVIAPEAALVSDGDSSLVEAFLPVLQTHQYDLVHLPRALGHTLWEDGQLPLGERKAYTAEVLGDVLHLKNSVALHAPAEEWDAIRHRIKMTTDRLERTIHHLRLDGCHRSASFLRKWLSSLRRFAEAALEERTIPWTSNAVERAMGSVSKRCKNKWMRWTEAGLDALLTLRQVRNSHPDLFELIVGEEIGLPTTTAITLEMKSGSIRDEF